MPYKYKVLAPGYIDGKMRSPGVHDPVIRDEKLEGSHTWLKLLGEDQTVQDAAEDNATEGAVDLAKEKGVDLSKVQGTGKDKRITKDDVQRFLDGQSIDGTGVPMKKGTETGAASDAVI